MSTITVTNPARRRRWGWSYSTQPTGHNSDIEVPRSPEYQGTMNQVRDCISRDRNYASFLSGGVYLSSAWFYDGQRILSAYDDIDDEWVPFFEAARLGFFEPGDLWYNNTLVLRVAE